ncbi:hypothetical protein D9615_003744 [Tricholomella constricta]|uniref:Uncharacterized protein n=1 Tax=Tricholomella constricta TaxID=117010 RepID=A0A8H5M7H7_9AGAR|nr:hypothetical protein D9615_003744 [Tricholomella constricta]
MTSLSMLCVSSRVTFAQPIKWASSKVSCHPPSTMSSTTQPAPPSPQVLKKMEKEIAKEGKSEESRVKHILDELSSTEKSHRKAEKAVHSAESTLHKAEKKELSATKAANKATHDHDIAVTKRHSAEQDAQMKKQQELKLQKEIQAKKDAADAAIKAQNLHQQAREGKLAELHGTSAQPDAKTGEQSMPGGERMG